jgi:hypothetical protein
MRGRRRRQRRGARRLVLVAAFAVLAASVYRGFQHVDVIYAQWTISHWKVPAGAVVYSTYSDNYLLVIDPQYQFLRNAVTLRVSAAQRLLGFGAQAGSIFCGELTSATGATRLVLVDGPSADGQLTPTALAPRLLGGPPRVVGGYQRGCVISGNPVRIYAGQSDPADASHFTIEYVKGDGRHIIDGWLAEDDQVLLEERKMERATTTVAASPE